MINFYRRFLLGISEVPYPLMDALATLPKKTAWLPAMQATFCKVKERLENAKMLTHPVKGVELHLITDASAQAIVQWSSRWWQAKYSHSLSSAGELPAQKAGTACMI